MKYHFNILLWLLIIFSCQENLDNDYPQYYRTYNQVLKLEKEENFHEAFKLFQQAEALVDFVPVQHLLKGRTLAVKLKDCDQVLNISKSCKQRF